MRIWAPRAQTVELVDAENGSRAALTKADDGWFEGPDPEGAHLVSVDGGEPVPQPRSQWMPQGILGPARVVDHDSYRWGDEAWTGVDLAAAVLYELHVGTFTEAGTFDAAVERLDHLVELGVDVVELLPVAEAPGARGWGYDGVLLWAPHHAYGGPEGMKRFVDACHARGLGVCLDVVYNHLGPMGNHLAAFGPYFTDTYRTPWGDAVNIDGAGSDEVRAFIIENACMWVRDYHVDGLRLDAVFAVIDTSAHHWLEQLSEAVHATAAAAGRSAFVIAENDRNDPRLVRPPAEGGYGLDGVWADDFHHAVHTALTGESTGYYEDYGGTMAEICAAVTGPYLYAGRYSPHRGHTVGRSPAGLHGSRFVVAVQNHDQVGNRAKGDRLSHLVGVERCEIAAALLLTSPFVPLLFQGEEWGASSPFQYFTDHPDPDLAEAVRQGRRREFAAFGWGPDEVPDPQDEATFLRSKLRWDELGEGDHARLLAWYRRLLALRRTHPALGTADPATVRTKVFGDDLFQVRRAPFTISVNIGTGTATLPNPPPGRALVLANGSDVVLAGDGGVVLPPDRVAIVRSD